MHVILKALQSNTNRAATTKGMAAHMIMQNITKTVKTYSQLCMLFNQALRSNTNLAATTQWVAAHMIMKNITQTLKTYSQICMLF